MSIQQDKSQSNYSTLIHNNKNNIETLSKDTISKLQLSKGTLTKSMQDLQIKLQEKQELLKNINVMTFNNQKYSYVPLDISIHKSIFTDNNPAFQDCLKLIKIYNDDIAYCKLKKIDIKNGPWKNKFYGTLHSQLLEIRFTKDRVLQQAYIEKIHEWAMYQLRTMDKNQIKNNKKLNIEQGLINLKQLRTKRSETGQTSQGGNTTLNTTVLMPQLDMNKRQVRGVSIDGNQKQNTGNILDDTIKQEKRVFRAQSEFIPSELIQEQLRDYKLKRRTIHKDIDPPSKRLENYKKKNITPPKQEQIIEEITKIEGGIVYPMPQIYVPQPEVAEGEQQDEKEKDKDGEGEQEDGDEGGADDDGQSEPKQEMLDGMDDLQLVGNEEQAEDVEEKDGKMVPKIKNFQKDEITKINIDNKDNNKVFEIKSNYIYYKPSNNEVEARLELKWQQNKQQELNDKRLDEEILGLINNYAINKGRLEKEINRKYESKIYGSNFEECQFKPKKYNVKEYNFLKKEVEMSREEEERIEQENRQKELEQLKSEQENSPSKVTNKQSINNDSTSKNQSIENKDSQIAKQYRTQKSFSVSDKPQMIDHSSFLPQIAKKDKISNLNTFQGVEKQINQLKIKRMKQQYGQLIGLQRYKPQKNEDEDEDDDQESQSDKKIVCQPSLSVYTRQLQQNYRPFSAVFDIIGKDKIRDQQLQEIQILKYRLAKHKINVPMKTLQESIVIPDVQININQDNLPQPGQYLMENPFFKVAAKKKKKKKGKKK